MEQQIPFEPILFISLIQDDGRGRLSQAPEISPQTNISFKLDFKVSIGFIKFIQKLTNLGKGLNVMDKNKKILVGVLLAAILGYLAYMYFKPPVIQSGAGPKAITVDRNPGSHPRN